MQQVHVQRSSLAIAPNTSPRYIRPFRPHEEHTRHVVAVSHARFVSSQSENFRS